MRLNFLFSDRCEAVPQPAARGAGVGQAPARVARPQGLGRIVPFLPEGRRVPVFFLHIPRCSGASVMAFLGRLYDGRMVTDAAAVAPEVLAGRRAAPVTDCVAGTVPLMRWDLFRDNAAYGRVTVLRDPWARLVSQINRLAVLGEAGCEAGSVAQMLAAEVAGADFTSRAGLERFRKRIQLVEGGFDNLQTRMLLTGTMSAMVKPILPRDVDRAVQELERFAVVGFCEDQVATQRALLRLAGSDLKALPAFEATGKPVALSLRNDLAREVFEPWIAADQDLYRRAKALVAARQPV
jgi:hypothetical protein